MSLSGLSGILAGVYALLGFLYVYRALAFRVLPGISTEDLASGNYSRNPDSYDLLSALFGGAPFDLILVGLIVLIAAVGTGIFLTVRKAKKHNEKIWDASSRRLLINFSIPLATGGAFCIALLQNRLIGLVAPCTLIFYGLALINASKFTLGDIKYLGLVNVIIGLISTQFIGYGLYFWALGFGIMHIIYGTLMYLKYDRK